MQRGLQGSSPASNPARENVAFHHCTTHLPDPSQRPPSQRSAALPVSVESANNTWSPPRRDVVLPVLAPPASASSSKIVASNKGDCGICLQIVPLQCITPCGHAFCRKCLDEWRLKSPQASCPTCRRPLPEAIAFAEARRLALEGDEHGAADKLRDAVAHTEGSAPWGAAHYRLGVLLTRRGDHVAAERELRRAAELRADDGNAALGWACSLLRVGRRSEAMGAAQRAVRLQPDNAEARGLLSAVRDLNLVHQRRTPAQGGFRSGLARGLSMRQWGLLRQRQEALPAVVLPDLTAPRDKSPCHRTDESASPSSRLSS
eukprot:gnl/MRDRNA2_/MRDRNA2_28522_c0_seq1.p1 gnl/MRDRNA2_/MRDRNA2_28522_c0~~gnl/MRDRNA2_/MRDRNA2_28522_c0_seq1.p1  ORF type:complete len:317 (-),score=54.61 gnl/MRDRNA2_/MRDRNA2_28522_c0_seq1:239-1189(-)